MPALCSCVETSLFVRFLATRFVGPDHQAGKATGFKGGEGSVWSREGFLLFSDYSQDRIYKYIVTPKGRIEAIARMQTRPNGVTLSPDGTILYVGNE